MIKRKMRRRLRGGLLNIQKGIQGQKTTIDDDDDDDDYDDIPVPADTWERSLSPLEMCATPNCWTILKETVPLPDAGAPSMTALRAVAVAAARHVVIATISAAVYETGDFLRSTTTCVRVPRRSRISRAGLYPRSLLLAAARTLISASGDKAAANRRHSATRRDVTATHRFVTSRRVASAQAWGWRRRGRRGIELTRAFPRRSRAMWSERLTTPGLRFDVIEPLELWTN